MKRNKPAVTLRGLAARSNQESEIFVCPRRSFSQRSPPVHTPWNPAMHDEADQTSKTAYVAMVGDLLHAGHINILEAAAELGNVIVGVITDEAAVRYSVRRSCLTGGCAGAQRAGCRQGRAETTSATKKICAPTGQLRGAWRRLARRNPSGREAPGYRSAC